MGRITTTTIRHTSKPSPLPLRRTGTSDRSQTAIGGLRFRRTKPPLRFSLFSSVRFCCLLAFFFACRFSLAALAVSFPFDAPAEAGLQPWECPTEAIPPSGVVTRQHLPQRPGARLTRRLWHGPGRLGVSRVVTSNEPTVIQAAVRPKRETQTTPLEVSGSASATVYRLTLKLLQWIVAWREAWEEFQGGKCMYRCNHAQLVVVAPTEIDFNGSAWRILYNNWTPASSYMSCPAVDMSLSSCARFPIFSDRVNGPLR